MHRNLLKTTLVSSLLLALALLVGGARPVAASAPCWKSLLNEWYSGRIQHVYALHCYQDALKHLPTDVSTYSSARDDIERALQSARAAANRSGQKVTPNTLIQPANVKVHFKPTGPTLTVPEPTRAKDKGLVGFVDRFDPGSPSALPLPLLILAGLALLLVAAGAVGMVLKRLQDRGPGGPPPAV